MSAQITDIVRKAKQQLSARVGGIKVSPRLMIHEGAKVEIEHLTTPGALPGRDDEDARRRRGGGGGGNPKPLPSSKGAKVALKPLSKGKAGAKLALTQGAQPVVFKIISGASGGRVAKLMEYLGTREGEGGGKDGKIDIPITTEAGGQVANAIERQELLASWEPHFAGKPMAKDIGRFTISVAPGASDEEIREALNSAFAGRPFVYAAERSEKDAAMIVTAAVALTVKGKGLPVGAAGLEKIEARLVEQMPSATIEMTGSGHAKEGVRYHLGAIASGKFGEAVTSSGETFTKAMAEADTVEWAKAIGGYRSRDVIHAVFSAKSGTDEKAFFAAVHATMDKEFGGHRYALASHNDKDHVHVHAAILVADGMGKRLDPRRDDLDRIRETLAESARENGLNMVATKRREVGASRPYTAAHVGLVEREEANPAIVERVTQKREKAIVVPDHPTMRGHAKADAADWLSLASFLDREGDESAAKFALNYAYALDPSRKPENEATKSNENDLNSMNGRPITPKARDADQPEFWTMLMSIRNEAELEAAIKAVNAHFDILKAELPPDRADALDKLRDDAIAIGEAKFDLEQQRAREAEEAKNVAGIANRVESIVHNDPTFLPTMAGQVVPEEHQAPVPVELSPRDHEKFHSLSREDVTRGLEMVRDELVKESAGRDVLERLDAVIQENKDNGPEWIERHHPEIVRLVVHAVDMAEVETSIRADWKPVPDPVEFEKDRQAGNNATSAEKADDELKAEHERTEAQNRRHRDVEIEPDF